MDHVPKTLIVQLSQHYQSVSQENVLNVEMMMTVHQQERQNVKIMSVFHVMTMYNVLVYQETSQNVSKELVLNVEMTMIAPFPEKFAILETICVRLMNVWIQPMSVLNIQLQITKLLLKT